MDRVKDKVVIITGAASGVGKADALLLAAEGARVVLTDINEEAGQAVTREIGDAACFVRHDIASPDDWQRVVSTAVEMFGGLDVLVNNAAICPLGSIEDTSLETWRKVMQTNGDGYFLGCKFAVAAMKTRPSGGSIINMSSVAALGGLPMMAAYTGSKGAVTALTRSVAAHCKKAGYRIR